MTAFSHSQSPPTWAKPQVVPRSGAERRIIDLVLRRCPITQAEITDRTEFTQQYVSKVCSKLLEDGLLLVTGRIKAGRGQPRQTLAVNGKYAYSVGVSIMTDAIALSMVDMAGALVAQKTSKLPGNTLDMIAGKIDKGIDTLVKRAGIKRQLIVGVGVAMTGFFVGDARKVNPPDALLPLAMKDIDNLLTEALHLPVVVDNDGNTAAAGEALLGVGRWAPTFGYIFISAGLGGGLVINGTPFRGSKGNAGEYANIIRSSEYYPTLETLRKQLVEAGAEFDNIKSMLKNFSLCLPGVDKWLEEATEPMSRLVSAINAVCDPDAIVLGGRLPTSLGKALIDRIEIFNSPRGEHAKPDPKLVLSEVQGDGASLGASMMPFQQVFY